MDWTALWLTLQLATATTAILAVVGIPLASWLASTSRRGTALVDAAVMLPLCLPPTVLGYYLLVASGNASPFGRGYTALTGERLAFSFPGILLASVLYNVPFAVRPMTAAFTAVDRRLVEASWCLGVSRCETFRRITFPLAWPGVLAGLVLTFAHVVGEFGVVLMVGGNIPGVTRTLSVAIYDDVQTLHYARAGQTSLWLVVFALVVLTVVYALQRRGMRR